MKTKLLIGTYALVAIVTFGHAFNNTECSLKFLNCTSVIVSGSMLASAFWPLYWSTQSWGE